jgi:hypothetical protein
MNGTRKLLGKLAGESGISESKWDVLEERSRRKEKTIKQ